MGQCVSRGRDSREYDAEAAVVGGPSPVKGLSRSLRRLAGRGEVLFGRDPHRRGRAKYSLRLMPPFVLTQLHSDKTVLLNRVQEEERVDQLVFRGVCKLGFVYTVMVRVDDGKRIVERDVVVSVRRGSDRGRGWGLCGRQKSGQKYVMELRWVKAAKGDDDYAVDYAMWLYR